MHKRISVGLTVTISIFAIIVTALITTAVTMSIYSTLVENLPEREAMYSSLAEIDNLIRDEYYGIVEEVTVNDSISDGYLSALTVGTNYMMSADEYAQYKKVQNGETPSVSHKTHSGVGYIKISDFTDTTPDEFKNALTLLMNDSVSGIVIDVRNTDSINIKSAAIIIDRIVPLATDGTKSIATAVDRNNANTVVFAADSETINLPVSVIVNEKTSGAGELLACDIKDFGKGTVVGKKTAGNGSYQKIFELSDGRALVLTVAKLLPYKSDCYDGKGVTPDYETDLKKQTAELSEDTQFLQAYASVTSSRK